MNKKWIVIGITAALVFLVIVLLLVPRKKVEQLEGEAYQRSNDPGSALFAEAQKFETDGDLISARQAYKRLITEFPDSSLVKDATLAADSLNVKVIFSPIATDNSVFYEVKSGDSLYKIAKEYKTTVDLIMKSNNLSSNVIKPGMKLKISTAKYGILVDKSQNILMLKSNDDILKTYDVSTGANNSTPIGTYKVVNKLVDPTWYKANAVVAPGSPDNILGSRWLGLNVAGYGIHGTTDETTIGQSVTQGCVRMKKADIEELYTIVPMGTEVTILD